MKLAGIGIGLAVTAATALLASLSFVGVEPAPPADNPDAPFVVTFPEVSEWDGSLLEMLRHKAAHCGDEVWIDSPHAKSACDMDVVEGSMRLVRQSHGNTAFVELLNDLGGALVDIRTLGEGGMPDQLVVTGLFAGFALDRAAILRGVSPLGSQQPNWPPEHMFGWMPEEESRSFWQNRWHEVRDEDCTAYPVPDCERKLDLAFSRVMNALPDELVRGEKEASARRLDDENLFRQNFGGRRSDLCLRTSGDDFQEAYRTCLERFIDENVDIGKFLEDAESEKEPAPARKLI